MIGSFIFIYIICGLTLCTPIAFDYQKELNYSLDDKYKLSESELWTISLILLIIWPIPFCFFFFKLVKKLIVIMKKK